jgi:SAM-dependent methyltransferase
MRRGRFVERAGVGLLGLGLEVGVSTEMERQYGTDRNLAARQRLWAISKREPPFDLFAWVLDLAGLVVGGGAVDPPEMLHPPEMLDLLDIGCGNGQYERKLRDRGYAGNLVALDRSVGMLQTVDGALAVRMQADAMALPFASDAFDVVLAPHMLYHVPDVVAAARECRRVLRPDGVFVAVTNGERNTAELLRLIERAVGDGWSTGRSAMAPFSLESGGALLAGAFDHVERVDCPAGIVMIEDADAVGAYVATLGDLYGAGVGVPWSDVAARTAAFARDEIEEHGAFRLTTSVGAFVCR